jgi:hypothetical protein
MSATKDGLRYVTRSRAHCRIEGSKPRFCPARNPVMGRGSRARDVATLLLASASPALRPADTLAAGTSWWRRLALIQLQITRIRSSPSKVTSYSNYLRANQLWVYPSNKAHDQLKPPTLVTRHSTKKMSRKPSGCAGQEETPIA